MSVAVTVFGREHKPAGSRTIEKARPFLRVPKFGFKVVFEVLYASVNKNVCEKKIVLPILTLMSKILQHRRSAEYGCLRSAQRYEPYRVSGAISACAGRVSKVAFVK